jgi:pyruvate-formate lyase
MPRPFDEVRTQLERQYLDAPYDPASGLSKEELVEELRRHRAENPQEPRILTRAWLFELLCTKGRIAIEPDDYFAGKVQHFDLMVALREEWRREEERKEFGNDSPAQPCAGVGGLDTGHTCPEWSNILQYGLTGLRDRAAAHTGIFYEAVTMVYSAAIQLAQRYAAELPNSPVAAIAQRPPETFEEALQLAYLYHDLQEMENGYSVRSMGRFDHLYNRFLVADLKAGRLTRDQAKELLKYFWVKFFAQSQGKLFGKPFLFGPEANELSYLAFEVYREMQIVDPKLHLRLSKSTPRDFLEQVVGCIQAGCTGIVTVNYDRQVEMLQENGKSLEDASQYILIGCYEPAVMGKELNCSGACALGLPGALELTLAAGDYATFDNLMTAYLRTLGEQFALIAEKVRREERLWPQVNPCPLLSGAMDSCIERGLDVSQGGAKYNTSGCNCVGIANVTDSLSALKQLVYEDGYCSLAEMKAALAANWEGYEELRLRAQNRVPRWGNNDDRADGLAVRITDFLGQRINHEPNARGGVFQAAIYAIIGTAKDFGRRTGALPDGRLAGEPLTMNTGATVGADKNGVTALINSVTKIDLSKFPNGTVLDIMLHPSVVRGAAGIQTICSIIESHFAQGGMAIQFNIFDAALLREAQRQPEKYANLQVRVCGWNARFIDLAPEEQEIYITKAEVA